MTAYVVKIETEKYIQRNLKLNKVISQTYSARNSSLQKEKNES